MSLARRYRVCESDIARVQPPANRDITVTQLLTGIGRQMSTRVRNLSLMNIGLTDVRVEAKARNTHANRSFLMRPNTGITLYIHPRDVQAVRVYSEDAVGDLNVIMEGERA